MPGMSEVFTYLAQGTHVALNDLVVFSIELTIFSLVMIHDIFAARNETEGRFKALAMVIFAPKKIKKISFWVYLGV